nr:Chain B, Glycosyl transferase, group 1 [synthetic construct]
WEYIPNV